MSLKIERFRCTNKWSQTKYHFRFLFKQHHIIHLLLSFPAADKKMSCCDSSVTSSSKTILNNIILILLELLYIFICDTYIVKHLFFKKIFWHNEGLYILKYYYNYHLNQFVKNLSIMSPNPHVHLQPRWASKPNAGQNTHASTVQNQHWMKYSRHSQSTTLGTN